MNPEVDFYFHKAKKWQQEPGQLRMLALDCGLTETLKWGVPCYTFQGSNIVLIHTFKTYCALLFHKGALLKDPEGILIQQTAQVQSARQIRFSGIAEIVSSEPLLKACIFEAVEVEKAGLKVKHKQTSDYTIPEEFADRLACNPALKTAFYALTPGRQRAYLLYFTQPVQSVTRTARVDKSIPKILAGKGLND